MGYWASMMLMVLSGGGLLWYYDRERQRLADRENVMLRSVGDARIGGQFSLVDCATGELVSQHCLDGG
jgi:hypothetical protein